MSNQQQPQIRPNAATGQLLRAIETGNLDKMREALVLGADVNWKGLGDVPLLLHTIKNHKRPDQTPFNSDPLLLSQKLEVLLEHKTPILRSPAGETPLSNVIVNQGDDAASLRVLLAGGADPDEATTGPAFGALDQAVSSGAVRCVATLLRYQARPDGLSGATTRLALEYHSAPASKDKALSLLTPLLEAGANPEPANLDRSPLYMAVDSGLYAAARALMEAGADPDKVGVRLEDIKNTPFKRLGCEFQTYTIPDPQTGMPQVVSHDTSLPSYDGLSANELFAHMEMSRLQRDTAPAMSAPRPYRL